MNAVHDPFAGGGEMGERMRAFDWSATPLGPVEGWPQNLKTCLRIMLTSRQPMFVWWGEGLINLYNDAYRSILGGKHPKALGAPAAEVWKEIWHQVGPRVAATLGGNEGTYDEALLLIMERNGYPEETYYTFSYSPIPDDKGGMGGILCANTDDTQRIVSVRRMALLGELAARTTGAGSRREVCARSVEALATAGKSLPFVLLYMADPDLREAGLAGAVRLRPGGPAAPESVRLDAEGPWPLRQALDQGRLIVFPCPDGVLDPEARGDWDRFPREAAIVPIAPSGSASRHGILVAGLNPYRPFDEEYGAFLGLIASQIASSLATAQAYEDERRRSEALAELNRAKTDFFSNVSHELRTPLTLILGPLDDSLEAARNDPGQRARLEMVRRNGRRLLKLVNNLLDFSRVEAGRVEARFRPIDLSRFTEELAGIFRSAAAQAGLDFRVECGSLPEPAYVDPEMWEKIVLNLLSNALKFTFRGFIAVRFGAEDGQAVLRVEDTGVGIPPEELPRIFTRFHRVPHSRTHEGTGIGLALVQELARIHGGAAAVRSRLGEGTEFVISIPLGAAHLPPEQVAAAGATAPGAPSDPKADASIGTGKAGSIAGQYVEEAARWMPEESFPPGGEISDYAADGNTGLDSGYFPSFAVEEAIVPPALRNEGGVENRRARILLADDNRDMREYVQRILAARWTVETAANGREAIERARRNRPDLVLSDVMMPELGGFGLLEALRADPSTETVPVILLSARAGEESTEEGLRAGADDYLVKPFSSRELVARVSARLEIDRLRRRREAEARESALRIREVEELNRSIISESPDCIEVLDAGGGLLSINRNGMALLEMDDASAFLGRYYPDLWGEHRAEVEAALDTARKGMPGRFQGYFPTLRMRAGRWWDVIITPLPDAQGRPARFLAVSRDITALRAAEREIHKFQSLVEQSSDFIGIGNMEGDPVYINAAGRRLVGIGPDQPLGALKAADFYFPEDIPGLAPVSEAVARTGHWEGELRLRHFRTGKAIPVWLNVFVLRDRDSGEPIAYATVTRDLSQLRETEEHLRQAQKMEAIGKLAGGIAHDFNNLLTGINGFADLALNSGAANGALREYLEEIRKSGERAALLTNQLLAYSRKQMLAPKVIDLNAILADMQFLLRRLIGEDIELEARLGDELGPIKADPGHLQQIILNLALNARDAMPDGGRLVLETANVILDERFLATHLENKPGPYVMLVVTDTGIGMGPDVLGRIFEPFFTTKPVGKGTGMGLSSVYGIVKQSEGAIDVESAPGRGSTFKIYLPMYPVAEAGGKRGESAAAARIPSLATLLLVEDEDSVRGFVRRLLDARGYRVLEARNGLEALELAESIREEIHLLLSDLVMPRMGGRKLAERFRSLRPGARIILMSGYSNRDFTSEDELEDGIAFLQKPFRPDQLIELVEEVLERTREASDPRDPLGTGPL